MAAFERVASGIPAMDDVLDHIFQLFIALEASFPGADAAAGLDKDGILAVHHDLSDVLPVHQFLENVESPECVEQG